MTDSDRRGPNHDAVVRAITEAFPDSDIVTAMGATFFSLDPETHWPNFATIVTTDEHDMGSPSNLTARPDVYRLNIGVSRETFDRLVGDHGSRLRRPRPAAPPPRLRPAALDLDPEPQRRDVRGDRQAAAHRSARPDRENTGEEPKRRLTAMIGAFVELATRIAARAQPGDVPQATSRRASIARGGLRDGVSEGMPGHHAVEVGRRPRSQQLAGR